LLSGGRAPSFEKALRLPSDDVKTAGLPPIRPLTSHGGMAHSASSSPSPAVSIMRTFDRKRCWPHHPVTCSRQFANVRLRLSLTEEEFVMATVPTYPRRLFRTKQAAEYLSMSEWKLRRLIQDEIIPFSPGPGRWPLLAGCARSRCLYRQEQASRWRCY